MDTPKAPSTLSPARLAACRANVRKAQEANRTKPMSPARRAALEKAVEANRRNWRLTPARLAAMRINGQKMQAASVAKFEMTDKRLAACRENIKKAQAAWRVSEKLKRPSYNDLKHGAYGRHVLEALWRLGEDPKEYAALQERLAWLLAPQNEKGIVLVQQLGDLIWQRRRVPRAAARWEEDRLRSLAGAASLPDNLNPYQTRDRARALWEALFNDAQQHERMDFFQSCIETRLRKLLRHRTKGRPEIWKAVKEFKPEYWQELAECLPSYEPALAQALKKSSAPKAEELLQEIWPTE